MVKDDLAGWSAAMREELSHKRFNPTGTPRFTDDQVTMLKLDRWAQEWASKGGAAVRIHDSGDFFEAAYLLEWLDIADQFPHILFYAYTKEVLMFRELVDGETHPNFRWVYSMGGKHDALVDVDRERHADVFPTMEALIEEGYTPQTENDLYAVLLPTTRIGVPANNIPAFKKFMQGKSFAELQRSRKRHD
jgi:hypothetical protein